MPVIIPTVSDPSFYVQQVELDGVAYRLELHWNYRTEAWYLSVYTAADEPLVLGKKLLTNRTMAAGQRYRAIPQGLLTTIHSQAGIEKPALNDLGADAQLGYIEQSEL